MQPSLWTDGPPGFSYVDEFIGHEEEKQLHLLCERVQFDTFEMRGVRARRRVKFYKEPIPDFLVSLRTRVAAWAGYEPERFAMALINEYEVGAPIGWHRDAPQYDVVAGISIGASCRMRFRPYVARAKTPQPAVPRRTTHEIVLMPRSAYLLRGAARQAYEHHIPAVMALRYSVTFRTLRAGKLMREAY